MGKGPSNGGVVANRGFIFQAIIAIIECLKRTDWDEVKMEPPTKYDKVDIQLYQNGDILSAIQVKSSINDFQRADAKKWLELARKDAPYAKEIHLYLVGDSYSASCRQYIQNEPEITTFPFGDLQRYCIAELVIYIQQQELSNKVSVADLELIYKNLFAETIMNSIAERKINRVEFERIFREAIPTEKFEEYLKQIMAAYNSPSIPQCLTPIPLIDKEIGLVGRDAVVRDIRKMLNENTCIVLVSGLGGIGKTAVMQGVCNDLKDEGHHVAWISCGESLQDDLLMMRDAFGIPKDEKAEEAYGLVKAGIQKLGKQLYLFVDDLSREVSKKERDAINELGVHVMITSRKENLPFRKKKLEYLADQDAIKMFYGYYGGEPDCEEAAWKIIESVNNHTLLVELLAKAAREEGGTLYDFYEKLKTEGFFDVSEEELKIEHDDDNVTIEECVIRLYEISRLSEEQQRIMKLFTIFSPEKEIFHKVRDWAGFDRKELKKLVDLGWLERGGLENGYHIHQIIRDSIARQVGKVKLEDYGEFLNKVIDTNGYLGKEVTYDKIRERLVLAEDVARFLDEGGREDADAGALFNKIAQVYWERGNYGKALEYYGKALAIRERVLGTDHPDTAVTYQGIAGTYFAQGNCGKALEYCEKALAVFERVFGTADPFTTLVYKNMAEVYKAQGEYEKALEYNRKVIAPGIALLGLDDLYTASTYENIAQVYKDQGDNEEALEYYGKALAIREQVLGEEHPDTAGTYDKMALVYYAQGDYDKALEYYGKSLAIRERVFGINHPSTVTMYNNMAVVYSDQGDYEKALEYYGKVLTIRVRVLGEEHQGTATTCHNMALVYNNQGDYEKALEYYGKALAIRERVFGMNHPDTVITYNNMAAVYNNQGDYEKALEYHGKVLAIRVRVLGEEHPDTVKTYNNMAVVYENQGDYEKALEYYGKALAIRERVLGTDHPDTATTYSNMAKVYEKTGDYEKALEYYGKALAIRERVLGEEHPWTIMTYNNIGNIIADLGDYRKALEYHWKVLAIRERVLGEEHQDTAMTYNNIGTVYRDMKNYEEALGYFRKSISIRERILGEGHKDTAWTYNHLGEVFSEQGEYSLALEYYQKALKVYLDTYGEEHPRTKIIKNNLAKLRDRMNQ